MANALAIITPPAKQAARIVPHAAADASLGTPDRSMPSNGNYVKLRKGATIAGRLWVLSILLLAVGADARAGSFGTASWYGGRFFHHRLMANGCPYLGSQMTAASRVLPLGSWVSVRNRHNDRAVRLQITDRGPFVAGRIIDVSDAASVALGMRHAGIVAVEVTPIAAAAKPRCVTEKKPRGTKKTPRGRGSV